jgi:hypothetical protein
MDSLQFVYWLQGFSEINGGAAPTQEQWNIIQDHLNLVFMKVTPDRPTTQYNEADTCYTNPEPVKKTLPIEDTIWNEPVEDIWKKPEKPPSKIYIPINEVTISRLRDQDIKAVC